MHLLTGTHEALIAGGLTGVHRSVLVLHHGDGPQAAHHHHTDQLQPDVEPLHGSRAEEAAALVELQASGVLFLEPAGGDRERQWTQC